MSKETENIRFEKVLLEGKIETALHEFMRKVGNCKIEIELDQFRVGTESENNYIDFGINVRVNVII